MRPTSERSIAKCCAPLTADGDVVEAAGQEGGAAVDDVPHAPDAQPGALAAERLEHGALDRGCFMWGMWGMCMWGMLSLGLGMGIDRALRRARRLRVRSGAASFAREKRRRRRTNRDLRVRLPPPEALPDPFMTGDSRPNSPLRSWSPLPPGTTTYSESRVRPSVSTTNRLACDPACTLPAAAGESCF